MAVLQADTTTTVEPTVDIPDTLTELEYVGVEFEYPVAERPRIVPVSNALESYDLRYEVEDEWLLDHVPDVPNGHMTGDHVGAEITSSPMLLHTTQPEVWYNATIERAEQMGHPFAAVGRHESTNFGLHLHLSPLTDEKAEALYELAQTDWARVFFCASVNSRGADPFRHGGCEDPWRARWWNGGEYDARETHDGEMETTTSILRGCGNRTDVSYNGDIGGHYEFRLPEPMLPDHFSAVLHFLRLLDVDGPERAEEYASELVYEANPILTPVQQYERLSNDPEWFDGAFSHNMGRPVNRRNNSDAAEFMAGIMGDM